MRCCFTSVAALLLLAGQAHGQSIEACRKLQENAARLSCYDKLPIPTAQPKAAPKTTEDPLVVAAKARVLKILVDPDSARFSIQLADVGLRTTDPVIALTVSALGSEPCIVADESLDGLALRFEAKARFALLIAAAIA
jgi:hypothetical protein